MLTSLNSLSIKISYSHRPKLKISIHIPGQFTELQTVIQSFPPIHHTSYCILHCVILCSSGSIHADELLKKWCTITSAGFNYAQCGVSASSCRAGVADQQLSSFGRKRNCRSLFRFPLALSLLLELNLVHRSLFEDISKKRLYVLLLAWAGMSTGVRPSQESLLCSSGSIRRRAEPRRRGAPDLQEWRRTSRFNYSLFSLLDMQPSLSLPVGSSGVTAKPFFWLGFSSAQFWPPGELLFSLAHVEALYHLSLSLVLGRARSSPLTPVRSVFTGTCKITWQEQLKALDGTSVPSVPLTFYKLFCFIKMKSSLKRGLPLCAKGSIIAEFSAKLQDDSKKIRPISNFSSVF